MLIWLTEEIPSRPVGLARIVVGGACVIRAIVAWPILRELATADVVHIPYASWLPDPSLGLVVAIVVVWFVGGVLFTIGWKTRLVGPVLLAAIVANLALDQQTYDNHVYLMAWLVFLLTLADAGAGLTVTRRDRPVVRWPVVLLMTQASVVYGFSGLTKLNELFLSGATLSAVLREGVIPLPEILRTPGILSALAAVVVFVELFIAVMLWRPRFRPAAFVLGLGLHASITLLMASTVQLLVFSLEMLALYPLFLGDGRLTVATPERTDWKSRIQRYDLLDVLEFPGTADDLTLTHRDHITYGAEAHTRILEHLVPWLWVAPVLRIPGISRLHERRHRAISSSPLTSDAQ